MLKSHSKPNANCFRITDENSEKKVAMVVIKLKRKSSWHPGPSTEGYFRPVSGTLGLLLGPRTLDLRQSVALSGGSAWWPAPCPHCLLNLPNVPAAPCWTLFSTWCCLQDRSLVWGKGSPRLFHACPIPGWKPCAAVSSHCFGWLRWHTLVGVEVRLCWKVSKRVKHGKPGWLLLVLVQLI